MTVRARFIALAVSLGVASGLGACGAPASNSGEAASPATQAVARRGAGRGPSVVVRRSSRLHVAVGLPDGEAWRVDERQPSDFVAEHEGSRSKIVVRVESGRELQNRARCEERARAEGFVPDGLRTVEAAAAEGESGVDLGVLVAVGASDVGYVFGFGASARKCVLVRYETRVDEAGRGAARAGDELSTRLAFARARVVPSVRVEPVIDVVPRASHDAPKAPRAPRF